MDEIIEIASPRGVVRLRGEREDDQTFRFALFCESRPELALLPLALPAREQLIVMQFRAQTISYRGDFPRARFDIIELGGVPIGRIVVDRADSEVHIVDQALIPPYRNLGIGSAIMRALMEEAARAGLPLRLQVAVDNASALRLYLRLGFAAVGQGPFHSHLEWRAQGYVPQAR
jgi:ribosomal protein S18 acetylase RimI-like enzyme